MKNLISILFAGLSLFSFVSSAHIELGTYTGKTATGDACSMEVTAVTFKDNVRHALHERVSIKVGEVAFELSHRPMLDVTKLEVVAEKELLTGVVGAPNAASGATVLMGERDEVHGPQVLTVIYDDYKKNENDKLLVCSELTHKEK